MIKSATAVSERTDVRVWYDLEDVDELSIEAVAEAREYLTFRGELEFSTQRVSPVFSNRSLRWTRRRFICGAAAVDSTPAVAAARRDDKRVEHLLQGSIAAES